MLYDVSNKKLVKLTEGIYEWSKSTNEFRSLTQYTGSIGNGLTASLIKYYEDRRTMFAIAFENPNEEKINRLILKRATSNENSEIAKTYQYVEEYFNNQKNLPSELRDNQKLLKILESYP
jgi:hypothetical protein